MAEPLYSGHHWEPTLCPLYLGVPNSMAYGIFPVGVALCNHTVEYKTYTFAYKTSPLHHFPVLPSLSTFPFLPFSLHSLPPLPLILTTNETGVLQLVFLLVFLGPEVSKRVDDDTKDEVLDDDDDHQEEGKVVEDSQEKQCVLQGSESGCGHTQVQ